MTNELKVVITLKGDRAMVGVQAPDCDPVFITFQGDLATALERVPAMVQEANQQWDANPRYPKAVLPLPPEPATPTPRQTSQPARTQSKKTDQPAMF